MGPTWIFSKRAKMQKVRINPQQGYLAAAGWRPTLPANQTPLCFNKIWQWSMNIYRSMIKQTQVQMNGLYVHNCNCKDGFRSDMDEIGFKYHLLPYFNSNANTDFNRYEYKTDSSDPSTVVGCVLIRSASRSSTNHFIPSDFGSLLNRPSVYYTIDSSGLLAFFSAWPSGSLLHVKITAKNYSKVQSEFRLETQQVEVESCAWDRWQASCIIIYHQ